MPDPNPDPQPDRKPDPQLDPGQQDAVRRLLADARHDDPVPEDVAARLDRVLARLASDGAGVPVPGGAAVTDLAARRRRRAMSGLAAAAAVVVLGVGLGQVVGNEGSGGDSGGSATSAIDQEEESSGDALGSTLAEPPAEDSRGAATAFAVVVPLEIRSERFAGDLRRARASRAALAAADATGAPAPGKGGTPGSAQTPEQVFDCTPADFGRGRVVAALYDGEPAVLAFRRAAGDIQVVDLLQCGTGEILRSVTLPAP